MTPPRSRPGQPAAASPLRGYPPFEQWDAWEEDDARAWPQRRARRYRLIPTICFNCEAGCGLLAYVNRESGEVRRFEGNPHHPGSRGRNCAKGPATLDQIRDPDRILHPMKRTGPRGSGRFERTTWKEVLETLGSRIRRALQEDRRTEILYHVGRPGADGAMEPVLRAWGVDGHNSHTNVCSAAARLGYALWSGSDRPAPDFARARFILLLSSHLETGHYFNPHAQRILEGREAGARMATVDVRLSNTASMSDWWIAPKPGTEAALLLGFAQVILSEGLEDRAFLERWTDWRGWLAVHRPDGPQDFPAFLDALRADYARYTPEWVAVECGVEASTVAAVGRGIGQARGGLAAHVWRSAASGNEGGWQVARCLQFLVVLTGSVGTAGGTRLASEHKFVPRRPHQPPPVSVWNELLYPPEWPLAHHEMSFLLPHLLREGRGRIDTYFTRVYNPVWTNPDGCSWVEMLRDEEQVGLHAALTPTWNETALWADYVLPMGHASERHDLMSQETHEGAWIGFRQPVLREALRRAGREVDWTWQANPGEVWEEDEFWIALSWEIDPDGALGVRRYFESPYRPGQRMTVEEQYRWIFENAVPGLPEAAAAAALDPLEYMRRHGAFAVRRENLEPHETATEEGGVEMESGERRRGFRTPSGLLEIHSPTLEEWGWPEHAGPGYIRSHVHPSRRERGSDAFVLVPTFRLPVHIHTRSANSPLLAELASTNPVWIHPQEAARLGLADGELVRVSTRIGHFVNRLRVTEGIRPGVLACSHHMGRWRLAGTPAANAALAREADLEELEPGRWRLRLLGEGPERGVHQNLAFPVQPDPVSGMHCWHQSVTLARARPEDRYGDVEVDTRAAHEVYREWLAKTRPPRRQDGLRRPRWLARAVRPAAEAFYRPPAAAPARKE